MRPIFVSIAVTVLAIIGTFAACNRIEQPAAAPEKVTIAYSATLDAALAQVAQMRGFYRQEGLEVIPQKLEYGKLALDAVLEGKADFATVAETPVMFAIMNGAKISVIATIQKSNSNIDIIARKDRGVLAPQDLKGRKIAVTSGTILDFYLDFFLVTNGLSRQAVTVVNMKPEQMISAIVNGDVDAITAWSHVAFEAPNRLGGKGITFLDKDIYTQTFNVVATPEFIRKNPAKVDKVLRALLTAEDFARRYPAEAQAAVSDFCRVDKAAIAGMWGMEEFSVSLDQSLLLALEDESRWAVRGGLAVKRNIPNYLDFVYIDGLKSVKPGAVRILR